MKQTIKSEETTFEFHKMLELLFDLVWLWTIYKMETEKIANLLNDSDNESPKFSTKNGMLFMIEMAWTMTMVKEMEMV